MKAGRQSILRRAVAAVLLLELAAAVLLTAVTAVHEAGVRYRAFDATLRGKAAALLGAVGEADDAGDGILLDARGLTAAPGEFYEVSEPGGAVLGSAGEWPFAPPRTAPEGGVSKRVRGRRYEVVALRGVRFVDPGERGGGTPHRVLVLYGGSTEHVEHEVWQAVRFYALTFAGVLLFTAAFLASFLRRALFPLRELTEAAGKLSARAWQFEPPPSATRTAELAPLSAAIEASVQRLERSFEQQRRFTADAAHELKTDVAIIKSSLQLLTMRLRTADEYRDGLARSLCDCERIEQTVERMLTLARLEHGGAPPVQEFVDLTVCASEAAKALGSMAELHGVRLRSPSFGPAPVALSRKDAALLCVNLLENAVQHSLPGSEVAMAVLDGSGFVDLEIRDSGEGIEAWALPHVFEPFFRADDARDRKRGGTGLGLAICKAICEKAGGSIEVASRPGSGTVVSVRLPLSPAPVGAQEGALSQARRG